MLLIDKGATVSFAIIDAWYRTVQRRLWKPMMFVSVAENARALRSLKLLRLMSLVSTGNYPAA